MGYLKHNSKNGNGSKPPKKQKPIERVPEPQDRGIQYIDVNGLDYLAESMNVLAQNFKEYVYNATKGENMLKVFTGEEGAGYYPVLIALDPCGEATKDMLAVGNRIATAFERIADAMAVERSREAEKS
jgi:hypothetical protein